MSSTNRAPRKADLRFLLTSAHDYTVGGASWVTMTARIVEVDNGTVRAISEQVTDPNRALSGLIVHGQAAPDDEDYGSWAVVYEEVHRVDLERATEMVSTLERIYRHLNVVQDSVGEPFAFAAYLARVAGALGIGWHGVITGGARSLTYEHMAFAWMDTRQMLDHIPQDLQRRRRERLRSQPTRTRAND